MNSSLTLENIIFDDAGRHEGSLFMQAPVSDISSDTIVQDAIVATYNNTATITLGDGAVLKNFGGMSAVRISGGELIMEDGSKIIDDSITDREKDGSTDFGPAGAVWMQGGTFEMEEGAYIGGASEDEWMVGRAVYIDGGEVTLNGTISRIEETWICGMEWKAPQSTSATAEKPFWEKRVSSTASEVSIILAGALSVQTAVRAETNILLKQRTAPS